MYDYVCTPHQTWMYGTVVVGSPDPASEPGLSNPDEDGELEPGALGALDQAVERLLRSE